MKGYIFFDIETFNMREDGSQDISCIAIKSTDYRKHIIYNIDGSAITQKQAFFSLNYLYQNMLKGYAVVSWNGLSFDIPLLAKVSGEYDIAIELARGHYDVMFQLVCLQGFGVSLDSVAKGLNIAGKLDSLSSSQIPDLWEEGFIDKVIAYVLQDLELTEAIITNIVKNKKLSWISSKGSRLELKINQLFNVDECLLLPKPEVSWMDDKGKQQWTRERFYSWFFNRENR